MTEGVTDLEMSRQHQDIPLDAYTGCFHERTASTRIWQEATLPILHARTFRLAWRKHILVYTFKWGSHSHCVLSALDPASKVSDFRPDTSDCAPLGDIDGLAQPCTNFSMMALSHCAGHELPNDWLSLLENTAKPAWEYDILVCLSLLPSWYQKVSHINQVQDEHVLLDLFGIG